MKEIPLSQGKVAIVDDADFERVAAHKWSALKSSSGVWYAVRGAGIRLHRVIINAPQGIGVDHKDHDGLNCVRSNLRLATKSQNGQNRAGAPRNSSTGVLGVHFQNRSRRYVATAVVHGKTHYFGRHLTLEAAAIAVVEGRRRVMTHAPECERAS